MEKRQNYQAGVGVQRRKTDRKRSHRNNEAENERKGRTTDNVTDPEMVRERDRDRE